MKRIFKKFLVATMMALTALGCTACGEIIIDLDSDAHACGYGLKSVGLEKSGSKHEFADAMKSWATTHTKPTVYTYHLLDSYTVNDTITIAENVYVGVCEFDYELTYNKNNVVLPASGNGGFFVYDCSKHGCYHNMDEALVLTNDYLNFAIAKTNVEAAANVKKFNKDVDEKLADAIADAKDADKKFAISADEQIKLDRLVAEMKEANEDLASPEAEADAAAVAALHVST